MCELVIMAVDSGLDSHRAFCRGDVIAAAGDGADWGREGSVHPSWRTLRLPNVSVLEAQALLSAEPETNPQAPNYYRQPRAFRLNLDAMPAEMQEWLADSSRAVPVLELPWAWADLAQYRHRVEPLADPDVIGV